VDRLVDKVCGRELASSGLRWTADGPSLRGPRRLWDAVDSPGGVIPVVTCDDDTPSTIHKPYEYY